MVYHVLANGTIKKDITGHVVKVKDAEAIYELLNTIKRKPKRRDKEAI